MVRSDSLSHFWRFLPLPNDVSPNQGVGAFRLEVHRFADVVKQPSLLGNFNIGPYLSSHHTGKKGNLYTVHQDVLPIAKAVFESPQQLDKLRGQTMYSRLARCLLSLGPDSCLDLISCPLHHLLNASGMNPTVQDKPLQCNTSNLPPHWIEARESNRFRGIINDQIDPGSMFQGSNVTPLPSN